MIIHKFILAIVGQEVSNLQRDMFALPVRYCGRGIANPVKTADREYETSRKVTESLTNSSSIRKYHLKVTAETL